MNDLVLSMEAPRHMAVVPHWAGKKSAVAVRRALDLLGPAERLVELFGGTGGVTLASGALERLWNDIDPGLYRCAYAVRADHAALAADCRALPTTDPAMSRLWDDMRRRGRDRWTAAEFAWATRFTYSACLGGRIHEDRGCSLSWNAWIGRLPLTADYLRGADLLCADWRDALAGREDWAVYADPPYEKSAGSSYVSRAVDYDELFDALERHSVAVVSGWSETKAPAGWEMVEAPYKYGHTAGRTMGRTYRREVDWVWRRDAR